MLSFIQYLKYLAPSENKILNTFIYINVTPQPKVVTATDEAELARQMERAEAENAEVAGDSAEEDEDNGQFDS